MIIHIRTAVTEVYTVYVGGFIEETETPAEAYCSAGFPLKAPTRLTGAQPLA